MNEEQKKKLVDAIAKGDSKDIKDVLNDINKKHYIRTYEYVNGIKTLIKCNEIAHSEDIEIEIITDRSQVDWSLINKRN